MTFTINELGIEDEDIDSGNVDKIRHLFEEVIAIPKHAKATRGSIVLAFGRFDVDPRSNFCIPEVRQYIKRMDNVYPFFPYFLPPAVEFQQQLCWFYSLAKLTAPIRPGTSAISVGSAAFSGLIADRIFAVRRYCERIYDEPSEIEAGILAAMPEGIRDNVRILIGSA